MQSTNKERKTNGSKSSTAFVTVAIVTKRTASLNAAKRVKQQQQHLSVVRLVFPQRIAVLKKKSRNLVTY